jgi:hypothetical protein
MRKFLILNTCLLFAGSSPVFAHGGHVGELAGHAHWVGVAAVFGAAAIAAVLAKGKKSEDTDASEEDAAEVEQEVGEGA